MITLRSASTTHDHGQEAERVSQRVSVDMQNGLEYSSDSRALCRSNALVSNRGLAGHHHLDVCDRLRALQRFQREQPRVRPRWHGKLPRARRGRCGDGPRATADHNFGYPGRRQRARPSGWAAREHRCCGALGTDEGYDGARPCTCARLQRAETRVAMMISTPADVCSCCKSPNRSWT